VAVLGARRPGVGAWNFVVLGLLAVMLLPLAESLLAGEQPLDTVRGVFLGATLGVAVLNYLPTRLGLAAGLLGLGCAWELLALMAPQVLPGPTGLDFSPGWLCLALVPWAALLAWKWRPRADSAFNELWRCFRDCFGLVWGQRLREQFNRTATNAGWPVYLTWRGLVYTAGVLPPDESLLATLRALRALLKRFLPAESVGSEK
jgi:hypothetical protein